MEERKTIDKASPFRSESKIRIWELKRPQIDGTMVDVLENGKDTRGGCSDMHESSQRKDKGGAIRILRSRHTLSHCNGYGHRL